MYATRNVNVRQLSWSCREWMEAMSQHLDGSLRCTVIQEGSECG